MNWSFEEIRLLKGNWGEMVVRVKEQKGEPEKREWEWWEWKSKKFCYSYYIILLLKKKRKSINQKAWAGGLFKTIMGRQWNRKAEK